MLNITHPKSVYKYVTEPYCMTGSIANDIIFGNSLSDTGPEFRLQDVYGEEIWLKLNRAGFTSSMFDSLNILETCAGTGFLTYHLLQRCKPNQLTVNDISQIEIEASKKLISKLIPKSNINWILGDMHEINFEQKFDMIIGNSFLHHFHNVPKVLSRFSNLLNKGGSFVSLHEPTLLASVIESGKLIRYPFAVISPKMVNNFIRSRYKGNPDSTDIWMFEKKKLKELALNCGFTKVNIYPWNLFRPIYVAKNSLHLNKTKSELKDNEISSFKLALKLDSFLNRFLPFRFFGSLCLVCEK